jgi:cytokine receptor domeless
MANHFNSKTTKCSGLKRGPQYGFWIWCTLIKCFISLPCIFSTCLGVDLSVRLQPEGVVSVRYGDPLEIFCIVENNSYTSNDLEFTLSGKPMPSTILNQTTIKLYIERPEKQVSAYYCLNKKTNKKCASRVLVDSPPMNVTDFKCVSKNLEVLNCSWTSPPSGATINYSLTFLINGNVVTPCKPEKTSNQLLHCTWNTSSEPRYRQQEDEYFFILKASNKFGENNQNFTIDHFSIVKPDPPSNLKLITVNPHSILLKWNIANTMADLLTCGVDHRIEYQIAKIDNRTYFHSVDATGLPPNSKTYKFLLKDLPFAYMQYEVRIYIKSKKAVKEEFWSDFTYKVFSTASEKPRRPPELIAGAFSEAEFHEQKMIWIYWKQLEEYEEAGANFTYKVLVSQGTKTQILYPDKNKSLSYVELTSPWEPMEVTVWSHNEMGSSENNSHLYIPPKTDSSLKVTTFTQLGYEGGVYKLSWVGKEKIDNYTLFWCQNNVSLICTGRMNFTVLDASRNSYEINLPKDHRYQFAISANNGTKTSGIVWGTCAISNDSIPMYGFPLTIKNDAPGKSFVRVTWTMTCTLQERIITGYLLKYCIVVNTSNTCDPLYEKKTKYIPNPEQMDMNITGLLPHKTYLFTLDVNTTYGLKTVNASRSITTTEDTPTSPRNVAVTDVQSTSLVISWDPPFPRNGIIGNYKIYDHEKELYVDRVVEDSKDVVRRNVTLHNLISFRNYSLTVQTCNTGIHSCSKSAPNEPIFVRTKIGAPSRLKIPMLVNNNLLKWDPPEISGGTVDIYQIKRVKDDNQPEIFNTTNLSFPLKTCEGVKDSETYEVRAVNFDFDDYSGVIADTKYVTLPDVKHDMIEHPSEWSENRPVSCRGENGVDVKTIVFICLALVSLFALSFGSLKLYKKYRKMGDIKPVLPDGLSIPEKDTKYSYGGWNPANKDEKSPADEVLLLPNSKGVVPSPEVKQKDTSNCGSSDHTDSTVLSDISRGPVDRQASTSDDSSNASLNSEVETVKVDDNNPYQDSCSLDNSDLESLKENSPYFTGSSNKDPAPVVNPATGYVQAVPAPIKNPKSPVQPAGSSYVMASLSPAIFTTGLIPPNVSNHPPTSSGYVRHDDAQIKSLMNLPNLGLSPTKTQGPESLPAMPSLPQPAKHGTDHSYIQLQSLNAVPSLKHTVNNTVPLKPQANNGYVSSNDPILHKHLNIMAAGQPVEESAILDPTMSPDAYCRFSWSTDPTKDNLKSFYSPKN